MNNAPFEAANGYLTLADFRRRVLPPALYGRSYLATLAQKGAIPGAVKVGQEYVIRTEDIQEAKKAVLHHKEAACRRRTDAAAFAREARRLRVPEAVMGGPSDADILETRHLELQVLREILATVQEQRDYLLQLLKQWL